VRAPQSLVVSVSVGSRLRSAAQCGGFSWRTLRAGWYFTRRTARCSSATWQPTRTQLIFATVLTSITPAAIFMSGWRRIRAGGAGNVQHYAVQNGGASTIDQLRRRRLAGRAGVQSVCSEVFLHPRQSAGPGLVIANDFSLPGGQTFPVMAQVLPPGGSAASRIALPGARFRTGWCTVWRLRLVR